MIKQKSSKKAQLGHGITWLWKFLILVLVLGGVIAIVISHYSRQFDVRTVEASIISRKLIDCIAPNGILDTITADKIKNCLPINQEETFINISLDNKQAIEPIGNGFLATFCETLKNKVSMKYPPACLESSYYVLNQGGQDSVVKIFIAIKKTDKNL